MEVKEKRVDEFPDATHILQMNTENFIAFEIQDGAGTPIGKVTGIVYTSPEAVKAMLEELIACLRGIGASRICVAYRMQDQDKEKLLPLFGGYGFENEVHMERSVYLEKGL